MKTSILFLSACLSFLGALGDEIKVGVVGLDTSHAIAFTKMLNVVKSDPIFKEFRMTAAYPYGSLDIPSSTNRYPSYIKQVKEMGVEIKPSLQALIDSVDVVLLETNDGRRHYEQALEIFKSGKRVFIDKPISASLPDAVRILDAAKKYNASFFTSSALRYVKNAQAARGGKLGKIIAADVYTPCHIEKTHSYFYWYAIHGAEPLFTIMGRGCREVRWVGQENVDFVVGTWKDGRIGTMRAMRGPGTNYGGTIYTARGKVDMGGYEGYQNLLVEILKFFKTGKVPVDPEETLEIFAFLEASAESRKSGGAPVTLESVLGKAKAEASR